MADRTDEAGAPDQPDDEAGGAGPRVPDAPDVGHPHPGGGSPGTDSPGERIVRGEPDAEPNEPA